MGIKEVGIEKQLVGMSPRKRNTLALAHQYAMPNRVESWLAGGIPLVIDKREGYRIWDMDGRELLDLHLNGGTYNLGHRNPEVLAALHDALERLDIGNHHFPSESRALLAEKLAKLTPGDLHYSVFVTSGSEAGDLAIKSARRATGRRKIVALEAGYHGTTGLSGAAGQDDSARYFCSDYPDEFVKVPFDDLAAMETALSQDDVAAVLLETIPATAGFPLPSDGYLQGVKTLCSEHGALYIADEVQTGLGRTGFLWGVEAWGVQPDILISGKGLSGGLYPISVVVMTKEVGAWLGERGWAHVTTFGGSEIGCHVASTVLDICNRPESLANARRVSDYLASGLETLQTRHPVLIGVRRKGLVMGLATAHPAGGMLLSAALYRNGVWAMFAGFDTSVLQFKPGLLVDDAYCNELLERLDAALTELGREVA